MDNLTHTLFGATLARTPLGRPGRGATAALILASNAPDIDIVTAINGAAGYLEWHRGPTHGPLGIVGLGAVVAGLVWAAGRVLDRDRRAQHATFASLLLGSILGVLCHVLMDLPTSYGTRMLSPFDWHWYAADLVPIIDIYLLAALAACLWFGRHLPARRRNVVLALSLMAINYGVRFAAHRQALAAAGEVLGPTMPERCEAAAVQGPIVDRWPADRPLTVRDMERRCLVEVAALPTFISPFQWRLVAQMSNAYETRGVDLLGKARRGPPQAPEAPWRTVERVPNRWTPAAVRAAEAGTARVFLGFSRFPAVRTTPQPNGDTLVRWSDLRFTEGAPGGRVDERRAGFFMATVVVSSDGRILDHRLGP